MERHRAVLEKAADVSDPEERENVMLTSTVYAANKKVSVIFVLFKRPPRVLLFALFLSWFKRPPRILGCAVGYAWRFDTKNVVLYRNCNL
jgi:hypothetical protein